ncbi:MAG: PHP domain-containing protein [Spirochaetaceae bacterium]|jgi:predicted metal-dependent phosphoesterase TrpH|nr:PHP domain-containing protein [Spirochaetaceae bacterium]
MIDLHSHTTHSDGTLTPEQLVDLAIKQGVTHLGITDHDCCTALNPAISYSKEKDIVIIPGIEIEVNFQPGEFHLLGLNLKDWANDLNKTMQSILEKRHTRNMELIKTMNNQGFPITFQDVQRVAPGNIIARPHFAQVMKEKGLVKNTKEAFDKYLAPGRPYYVKKEGLSLEEALDLVHRAGGKSVLAHPLSLYISWGKMKETLMGFKDRGLQGIEAWHSGARLSQAARFSQLAKELGFFITGGSDFHGSETNDRQLGRGPGKRPLEEDLLEGLY